MNVFYDHLTDWEALDTQLQAYLPEARERAEVLRIFDATLHHVVMDTILQALPADLHELYVAGFRENPADPRHLIFLRQHAPTVDSLLEVATQTAQRQFIDTIHAA
jgi:hypothetical protein